MSERQVPAAHLPTWSLEHVSADIVRLGTGDPQAAAQLRVQ